MRVVENPTANGSLNTAAYADPRLAARELLKTLAPHELRSKNADFLNRLMAAIRTHAFMHNRALAPMRAGTLSRAALLELHRDFKHAGVEVFTDVILMAQFQTRVLTPRFGLPGKMTARFLLALNVFDEFGFIPPTRTASGYQGHPLLSHTTLFDAVIAQLDSDTTDTAAGSTKFCPSPAATALRASFEATYDDLLATLAAILVAEEVAMHYSPAMRAAVHPLGLDVERGYYMVHGRSTDNDKSACDDFHQQDVWHILALALEADDYLRFEQLCMGFCQAWEAFWAEHARRWVASCS